MAQLLVSISLLRPLKLTLRLNKLREFPLLTRSLTSFTPNLILVHNLPSPTQPLPLLNPFSNLYLISHLSVFLSNVSLLTLLLDFGHLPFVLHLSPSTLFFSLITYLDFLFCLVPTNCAYFSASFTRRTRTKEFTSFLPLFARVFGIIGLSQWFSARPSRATVKSTNVSFTRTRTSVVSKGLPVNDPFRRKSQKR